MNQEKQGQEFTKYETARILGARALQISMGAPLLLKISKDKLEEVRYDSLQIAEIEFNARVLPITVKRPLPKKIEGELKREKEAGKKKEEEVEQEEEKEIGEGAEIMELVKPEEEVEEEISEETKEEAI